MAQAPDHDRTGHADADRAVMVYTVSIDGAPKGFACRADQTVIEAMRAAGRSDLTYGCRGGGCGACRVEVKQGHYASLPMSAACVTQEQQEAGLVLACRIKPRDHLTLMPAPLRWSGPAESCAA